MTTGSTRTPTTAAECLSVLGLDASASAGEVKKAFRRLVRQLHPDKAGTGAGSKERFLAVVEAYHRLEVLGYSAAATGRKVVPPQVQARESWSRLRKPELNYAWIAFPCAVVAAVLVQHFSCPYFEQVFARESGLSLSNSLSGDYWDAARQVRADASVLSYTVAVLCAISTQLLGFAGNRYVRWRRAHKHSHLNKSASA